MQDQRCVCEGMSLNDSAEKKTTRMNLNRGKAGKNKKHFFSLSSIVSLLMECDMLIMS